jgi:uncharacterized protein (UPF0262 family)
MKKALYNLVKLAIVAIRALPVGSCQKPYEMDLPLAESRAHFTVNKEAGQVFFIVYSQANWTAELERPVTWLHLSRTSGSNYQQINVSYDENADLSRGVNIIVRSGNLTKKVYVSQKAGMSGDISYNIEHQSVSLLKGAFTVNIAASNNIPASNFALVEGNVDYIAGGEAWIQNISIGEEKLSFDVAENTTGEVRQAILKIVVPVAEWDTPITTMVAVTQGAENAALGSVPATVVADPNGINRLSIELAPNFAPTFYNYTVEHSIAYTEGESQNWLRNATLDGSSFKFTAEPKPNPNPLRTAAVTFVLKDESGAELDRRVVTITQEQSNMGTANGGNENGEEPKDPEEDF